MSYGKMIKSLVEFSAAIGKRVGFIEELPHEYLTRVQNDITPRPCPGIETLIESRILNENEGNHLINLLLEDYDELEIGKQRKLTQLEEEGRNFLTYMVSINNTPDEKIEAWNKMKELVKPILQEFGLVEAKHEAPPPEYQAQALESKFVNAKPPKGASPEAAPPGEASQAVQGSPPKYEPPPPPPYQGASPQSEQASRGNQPQNEPPPYQAPAPAPSQPVQAQPVQASPQNEPPEETGDEDEQHGQGGSRPG